jgi:hypothetical protein
LKRVGLTEGREERDRRLEVRNGENESKLLDVAHPLADVTLL